jgi:hypothetical protein
MLYIYIPARSADDWQQFLAEPEKQWRIGFSARTTAYAWQESKGFPDEIATLFASADDENLRSLELLLAIPEHKVYFPPMQGHPSQNDVFALAKTSNGELVSVAVEAKVAEPFDQIIDEWIREVTPGKEERLEFLKTKLGISGKAIGHIRYQLTHRLASAIIEAERFNAKYAVLVIHSFSQSDEWFEDFAAFVSLYDQVATVGRLAQLDVGNKTQVFAGWARGNEKYLDA